MHTFRLDSLAAPGLDGHVTPAGTAVVAAETLSLAVDSGDAGRLWLILPAIALPRYHRVAHATLRLTAADASAVAATLTVRALADLSPAAIGSAGDLAARTLTAEAVELDLPTLADGDLVEIDVADLINAVIEDYPADSQPRAVGFVVDVAAESDVEILFHSGAAEDDQPELALELQSILNVWEGDSAVGAAQVRVTVEAAVPSVLYRIDLANGAVAYRAGDDDTTATIAAALAAALATYGTVAYTSGQATFTITASAAAAPFELSAHVPASTVEHVVAGSAPLAQQITLSLPPTTTSGTWDVEFDFGSGAETLTDLAHDISAAALQTAIEGLTTPAPGDVTVAQTGAHSWRVTLSGSLLGTNSTTATIDSDDIVTAGAATITTVQAAEPAGPGADLYQYEELSQVIYRRFRLGAGAWTAYLIDANPSATTLRTVLQSLVSSGDADAVQVDTAPQQNLWRSTVHKGYLIRMPTGYATLQVECIPGAPDAAVLMQSLATDSRDAWFLVEFTPNAVTSYHWRSWRDAPSAEDGGTVFESGDEAAATPEDLRALLLDGVGDGNVTFPDWDLYPEGADPYAEEFARYYQIVRFTGSWGSRSVGLARQTAGTSGWLSLQPTAAGVPTLNQIDELTISADGGTFTITAQGDTTDAIGVPTTASTIANFINAAAGSTVAAVTLHDVGVYRLEWRGDYGGTTVTRSVDGGELTGGNDGTVDYTTAGAPGVNAQQRITADAETVRGTLRARLAAVAWSNAWPALTADGAAIESALAAALGEGNATVTGPTGGPWLIEFDGALAEQPVALLDLDQSRLFSAASLLTVETLNPGGGPTRWDVAANWSLGRIPQTHDVVVLADGDTNIESGYIQAADFTAEAGDDRLFAAPPVHFAVGQEVRVRSTGTPPETAAGPLAADRSYWIVRCDRVRGEIQIADRPPDRWGLVPETLAFVDPGEGIHTIEVQFRQFLHRMPCRSQLGLPRRSSDGELETRPQYLRCGFLPRPLDNAEPQIMLGVGEGSGSTGLRIDCWRSPATIEILNTGSASGQVPPVQLLGLAALEIVQIGGEAALALLPGESSRFGRITLYGGSLALGRDVAAAPGAVIDRFSSAALLVERCALDGATLQLRG